MDIQEAMKQVDLTQQIQAAITGPALSDVPWTESVFLGQRCDSVVREARHVPLRSADRGNRDA